LYETREKRQVIYLPEKIMTAFLNSRRSIFYIALLLHTLFEGQRTPPRSRKRRRKLLARSVP